MKIALDVHYRPEEAKAVALAFEEWTDAQPLRIATAWIQPVADYVPGQFYRRELPCLLRVLEQFDLDRVDLLLVDGYVDLDEAGRPGLGSYLYEALPRPIPIIGVAKKHFHSVGQAALPLYRGNSQKALYISARDFPLPEARERIARMTGPFRMPELLKILDRHTKD